MSSNPNNAVGTNAAYGGRTSVKAVNDNIGAYSRGIISGWACSPSSGMTVSLGGDGTKRDIAIAEDVSGNKITVNNISEAPISVTMSAAPASNSRIDLIVAYVDNPPQGSATALDNPAACGLITVKGTAAVNPVAPNESAIRTAITADGASGSTAYYVILAQITIASGTTDIVAGNISAGSAAGIGAQNIDFDIRTGTGALTLPAGKWLVTAVAIVLTTATGSFSTDVSWLGRVQLFQGYRTSNENRTQTCLTWTVVLDVSTTTTYPINFSGSSAETASRQWTAIKISN